MQVDYSLVICTYNPDERLLERCLVAVNNLDKTNIATEIIIVDNNSTQPVAALPCVVYHLQIIANIHVLQVAEQGVGHARLAAIERASGKYTVYFDYDNEPEKDYLQQLQQLNDQLPSVAAWGPGNVTVDFIDGIDTTIEAYARIAFQEKHQPTVLYDTVKEWQAGYPFGTGLCTLTAQLRSYAGFAAQGTYTMPGRKGARLSGGEDTQMVLHCIKNGFAAGTSPALKLQHVIPASRANFSYLKRFAYHTGLDYMSCLLQVFPEQYQKIAQLKITPAKFSRQLIKRYLKLKLAGTNTKLLDTIRFIGFNEGIYRALQQPVPPVVKSIVHKLNLK